MGFKRRLSGQILVVRFLFLTRTPKKLRIFKSTSDFGRFGQGAGHEAHEMLHLGCVGGRLGVGVPGHGAQIRQAVRALPHHVLLHPAHGVVVPQ